MANATNRWLDKLAAADKAKGGTGSDYSLAKLLETDRQLMSRWRRGVGQMGNDAALLLAQRLDVHPMVVLAEIAAERSRDVRMQRAWHDAAKHYGKKAALAGAVILTASMFTPQSASASRIAPSPTGESGSSSVYYVKHRRRYRHRPPSMIPGRIRTLERAAL